MNTQENTHNNSRNLTFQSPLVMLVDDSEITNYVNSKLMKRYEFSDRILIYEDPTLAFAYLENASVNGNEIPAIIFLDLNMPQMDGRTFVEKFEQLPELVQANCKIIILSSSSDPKDKSNLMARKSVHAYFSPPLIKSNFVELVSILKKFRPVNRNEELVA